MTTPPPVPRRRQAVPPTRVAGLVLQLSLLALVQSLLIEPAGAATFCTVTINSPDERQALRQAFPDERFVELTEYAPAESPRGAEWLTRACQAGIQCDVLLVSGHFANRFFGDTPFDLPVRTLEQQACQASCDGVLTRPRLVFLFGCNSLAGKRPDHRSPGQYRDILVRDGLEPDRADRAVALRYFPLGDATRARIQKIFSRGALVFGFSSTSPLGEEAGPLFARYLRQSRRQIEKALQGPAIDRKTRDALVRSWKEGLRGTHAEFVEGGPPLSATECRFRDPDLPRLERLLSAEQLLVDAPVENALLVHDFLLEQADWDAQETAILARMTDNAAARREVLETLAHLPDSRDVYFSMLRLAHFLGWLDGAEVERRQGQRLRAMLRDGVSRDELGFLCSRDLSYVPPPDVLARNRRSLPFVRALPCLEARSEPVRRFLLARVAEGSLEARVAVLDALRELHLLVPADVERLVDMYRVSSGELRESLLWALAASDGSNVRVQRLIGAAALDPDADVAWTSAQILKQLGTTDGETQYLLATALAREDGFVRRGVALAFEALHPEDASVLASLRPFLLDPDPVVRQSVTHVLVDSSGAEEVN